MNDEEMSMWPKWLINVIDLYLDNDYTFISQSTLYI